MYRYCCTISLGDMADGHTHNAIENAITCQDVTEKK